MCGYFHPPNEAPPEGGDCDFDHAFQGQSTSIQQPQSYYAMDTSLCDQSMLFQSQQYYQQPSPYQRAFEFSEPQPWTWMTRTIPSNYIYHQQSVATSPQYVQTGECNEGFVPAGPSRWSTGYLSPEESDKTRISRLTSLASNASSVQNYSHPDVSRSVSPCAREMAKWGFKNKDGTWSCAYPGCVSQSKFIRGCDLRKHYKRHNKSLLCRHEGCPQATEGGFSSKKDRARHEAKHNPNITCEWEGCDRLFSRVDNMKDHVRRVHRRELAQS